MTKQRPNEIVTFYLNSAEPCVYLVGQKDDQKSFVIPMQQIGGLWCTRLELDPGDYRFRYYSGDDRNVVYLGPAATTGTIDDGLDAVMSIGKSRGVNPASIDTTLLLIRLSDEPVAFN